MIDGVFDAQFSPNTGPVNGGTLVTIHGHNFGSDRATLSVRLGSVECSVERHNNSL